MGAAMIGRFLKDDRGGMTVEFVAIASFFFIIAFMAIEVALAIFWWQTADVAAQAGARFAVVSAPAVPGLSASMTNGIGSSGSFGQSCDIAQGTGDPCTGFATQTCDGETLTGCNTANFDTILAKMQSVFGAIQAGNVDISYSYVGLGFVGGPIVPAVTVTVSGVPFNSGIADILGLFFDSSPLTTVPAMTATFTGEDLSSAGA